MLRFLTSGESHGQALIAVLDGFPAGMSIDVDEINEELRRRQQGYGRGARQKIENDQVEIVGGIRHGITSGAPISLIVRNRDWENWKHVMSVESLDDETLEAKEQLSKKEISRFRPGHADLAGTFKFRQRDIRDVLERASARETAARVAVGAICKQLLEQLGITIAAHVVQVGNVPTSMMANSIDKLSLKELHQKTTASELFCVDVEAEEKMKEAIKKAWQDGDTLGGVIEVLADGCPIGLGSYTQWDEKLDAQLSQAIVSIQAIKAVEIGCGVSSSSQPGSLVHDAIHAHKNGSKKDSLPFYRTTNHAGGIEGGMTNGERLCLRAYMKPIPTLRNALPSLSFPALEESQAHYERSDVCSIAAASVVCKAMVAFILSRAILQKFGGDNFADIKLALQNYRQFCSKPNFDFKTRLDFSEAINEPT